MKANGELEPGVLPTFRLFIGVQLVISVLTVLAHWFLPLEPLPEFRRHLDAIMASSGMVTQVTFLAFESFVLFLYLSLRVLQRVLGRLYLPLGIAWAAAGPMLGLAIDLHTIGANPSETLVQSVLWQQMILLFIPLVVISWQYSIRTVMLFVVLVTLLNLGLWSEVLRTLASFSRAFLGLLVIQCVAYLLVGHMIANLLNVQREQRQRLTEAYGRLTQYASAVEQLTISQERNRMARELHDALAHTLSGVAVELEGSRTMLRRDPDRAEVLLNHSLQAIREGLIDTRRALQELRSKPLEDLGLALAVQTLAESYAGRFDLALDTTIARDLPDYPMEVQQCVYRVAQEALANAAHHARAQHVQVTLKQDDGRLQLIIQDDGCGFDPAGAEREITGEEHYGLRGMRERTERIGGTLAIASEIGKGTRVCFAYDGRSHLKGGMP